MRLHDCLFNINGWMEGYELIKTPPNIDYSSIKLVKIEYDVPENNNVLSPEMTFILLLSLYDTGTSPSTGENTNRFLGGTATEIIDLKHPEKTVDPVKIRDYQKAAGLTDGPVSEDYRRLQKQQFAAALINVVFFTERWKHSFVKKDIFEKFYVSRDIVMKKQMMGIANNLNYTESKELGARMVEVPYNHKHFRMVVVLPNKRDGLPSVLEKIADKGILSNVSTLRPANTPVLLKLPMFQIIKKLDLKEILPKVEVNNLYVEPVIPIVNRDEVSVCKAFQKAIFRGDGTFTGFADSLDMICHERKPIKFIADHPFLYLILVDDKIVYAGTYTQ